MATQARILFRHLFYQLPESSVVFNDLNICFESLKYGLVGRNGVGKSTLLKLIVGEYLPDQGSIETNALLAYMPQRIDSLECNQSVAQMLGVSEQLDSSLRINNGSINAYDCQWLGDDWGLGRRLLFCMDYYGLSWAALNRPFSSLSEGQKSQCFLVKAMLNETSFFLMDEPTTHLDSVARQAFYHFFSSRKSGALVVSHDRQLLNACDCIIECSDKGLQLFGGSYDFYKTEKEQNNQALNQAFKVSDQLLKKKLRMVKARKDKHNRNQSRGKRIKHKQLKAKGCTNKIEIKSMQARSESTVGRIRHQPSRQLEQCEQRRNHARDQLMVEDNWVMPIAPPSRLFSPLHCFIEIDDLSFSYDHAFPMFNGLSFQLLGRDRVALKGKNGCGKSTLLHLTQGRLRPNRGSIKVATDSIVFLDQNLSFLYSGYSILENFCLFNPGCTRFEAHQALAFIHFKNNAIHQCVDSLSGGERMRVALAVCLMGGNTPCCLVLDEPNNHLDLSSLEVIEAVLKQYQGALMVVSHDDVFLNAIGIEREFSL